MTLATNPKSKIVICTHEFFPFRGGVAAYSEELAAALHRAGENVEVWAPDYGGLATADDFGFGVVRLHGKGSLRLADRIRFANEVMGRRAQLKAAMVVLTSVGAHMAFMVLMPLGRLKCRRTLSVLHGSEILRFHGSRFWRFWARRFFPHVECVFTVSEYSRSLIEQGFLGALARRIEIASCACSTAAMQPCDRVAHSDGKLRVLTLARVHPRKGQLDTARALARLPNDLRSRTIYQVGGIGDASYLQQVATVCREAGVAFEHLGQINPDTLATTYEQCDVCAMTSRTLPRSVEGFGISYLEAGFHGKPVVGYRSGGAAEAVVDGETGLLVKEGDVEALTEGFQRLLGDTELRQRLGEGGRRVCRDIQLGQDGADRVIESREPMRTNGPEEVAAVSLLI